MSDPKTDQGGQSSEPTLRSAQQENSGVGDPSTRTPQSPRSPDSTGPPPDITQQPVAANIPFDPHAQEDENDEHDSAFGDEESVAPSTSSLSSSIFDYRHIHGRTFQSYKTTEYWSPNDDKQNEALDISHQFMTMLKNDELYEAPIKNPKRVLDVGTGTGIWAIDMADRHPDAEIIGMDISPIQPSWVPPNCKFHIDDAELEWTYEPGSFDLIHMRQLYGSVGDWTELFRQAYKALEPGGWIEDTELNITLYSDVPEVRGDPNHIFRQWSEVFYEAMDNRRGKTAMIGTNSNIRKHMAEAGFVDIDEKNYHVPCGGWSSDERMKMVGLYNLAFLDESLEGFSVYLLGEVMEWDISKVHVFVARMRNAIRDQRIRPYYIIPRVYGRKPETG